MKKKLNINGSEIELEVSSMDGREVCFELNGTRYSFTLLASEGGAFTLQSEHGNQRGYMSRANQCGEHQLMLDGMEVNIGNAQRGRKSGSNGATAGRPIAPMPGLVQKVLVKVGDDVEAGDQLVVMEAMKMQITISAHHAGTVAAVNVSAGDQVQDGDELVQILSGDGHAEDAA